MQINSSLTALGNLLAQIQADNPGFASVTEAQLALQSVSAVTPDADGRNSVAVVSVDGYTDTASFTFTRLQLTDSIATAPTSISLQGTENADQVATIVAQALNLVADEVVISASFFNADGSITQPTANADGTVTGSLSVVADSGTALYVDGATISLTVNFPSVVVTPPAQPSISTIVTQTALSGFTAVTAPAASTDGTSSTTTTSTDGTTPATDGTSSSTTTTGTDGASSTTGTATDGTSTTGTTTTSTDGQTGTTGAATDGQASGGSTAATDGTTSSTTTTTTGASDGSSSTTPAEDGTSTPVASDGQAAATTTTATDGASAAPVAAGTDGTAAPSSSN
jgi:hypothetical protein